MKDMKATRMVLTSNVNFYISIVFLTVFGLSTTTVLLKFAQLEDPVTTALADVIVSADE